MTGRPLQTLADSTVTRPRPAGEGMGLLNNTGFAICRGKLSGLALATRAIVRVSASPAGLGPGAAPPVDSCKSRRAASGLPDCRLQIGGDLAPAPLWGA